MKLSSVKVGYSCVVKDISPSKMRDRFWEMGLVNGTTITVIHSAPFHGPMEIYLRGYYLTLRRDDASFIEVSQL